MLMFVFRGVILNLTSARVAEFAFSPVPVRISMGLDTRRIIPTREAIAKIDTAAAKQHAHKLLRLGTLHDIEEALAAASP